jgi:peptidyl-prolyl cis-trans isomerase A (cyclophilin A)
MIFRITKIFYSGSYLLCMILVSILLPPLATAATNVRMQTDLGSFDIELFDTVTPLTVANYMNYVNDGDYEGTFFHRSIPGFIVQGGGYLANSTSGSILTDGASLIPTDPPVVNEFNLSNLRGTIAMAKVGGDPDSATSQ